LSAVNTLEKELGKVLGTEDISQYTGLDVKTIRKYYKELGGMRLGRRILFFERSFINAISNRTTKMEGPSAEKWETERQNIQHEEGGCGVGSHNETKTRRRLEREDKHGLFG